MQKVLGERPKTLSKKQLRQIRIVMTLCKGETGASIARREKLTTAAVSKIRKSAAKLTVARFLERLIHGGTKARQKPNGIRPSPGRPGYEHFDQWVEAIPIEDEPIFEVSTIILSRTVQIATISVREGTLVDYGAATGDSKLLERREEFSLKAIRQLQTEIRDAAATEVFWTRVSMQDTLLQELFQRLNGYLSRLSREQDKLLPIPTARPLKERFGERFRHLVLFSGPKNICQVQIKSITKGLSDHEVKRIPVHTTLGLLRHLEAALHHRRLKKSSAGFLPLTPFLSSQVREGTYSKSKTPWLWQADEQKVRACLKIHIALQDYITVQGILISMKSCLWSKIPYLNEVAFRTIPLTTRVKVVASRVPGFSKVMVTPMPGMEYQEWVEMKCPEKKFLNQLRQRLRSSKETKRFIYDARPPGSGGTRASITVPADFLIGKSSKGVGKGLGAVLLPRHFLAAEPEIALENLIALAAMTTEGASLSKSVTEIQGEAALVLHAPYILPSIRRNVEDSSYWEQLADLESWQSLLSKPEGGDIGAEFDLFLKFRAEAVLEQDWYDKMPPSVDRLLDLEGHDRAAALCALMEDESKQGRRSPVTENELQELLMKKVIPDWIRQALSDPEIRSDSLKSMSSPDAYKNIALQSPALETILGGTTKEQKLTVDQSSKDGSAPAPDSLVRNTLKVFNSMLLEELMRRRETKAPDANRDLANILKELDADYIIRNLDSATWKRFRADAEAWAHKCQQIILEEYWSGSRPILGKWRVLIHDKQKMAFDRYQDEAASLGGQILTESIGRNTRFAMRRLIENMQRCVLRGLPPVALAVETVTSVMNRWRALLGARITGRLEELNSEDMQLRATMSPEKGCASNQTRGGMHADAEISGDEVADETEDFRGHVPTEAGTDDTTAFKDSVDAICDLLNSPDRSLENGCRKFFGLAHQFGSSVWQVAIANMVDAEPDGGWKKLITEALTLCEPAKQSTGGPSPTQLRALQRLLSPR